MVTNPEEFDDQYKQLGFTDKSSVKWMLLADVAQIHGLRDMPLSQQIAYMLGEVTKYRFKNLIEEEKPDLVQVS